MKTKFAIAILLLVAIVGGLAGVKKLQFKKLQDSGKSFSAPPETVATAVAREEQWQGTFTAIGSITAVQGVYLSTEIAGTVTEIAFESGAMVKEGDLLLRLDTSSEKAQLRAVEAQLDLARINLDRSRTLYADKTLSQADLDSAEATLKQLQANADTIRVTIEKKTLRAPFTGGLGIRQVNLGQYLEAGKPIVWLQSMEPVYADFSLPQQQLAQLQTGMKVRVTTDAYPDRQFDGTLTAINPGLDQNTRSVNLRATLPNPDHLLHPGMFARVEVLLPEEKTVVVVPATSVLSAPFGDSVYVVVTNEATGTNAPSLSVKQQFIRTGRMKGDFVAIESGVKAGDKVVRSGIFKLRPGSSIVENNDLVPKTLEAPKPSDS
jgi:membrane fusion protein (multidrug efflux system)